MGMVVPTHRERLCQALGTVVTPRWHNCAKGVARARHQRPSLPSYIGGFSSTIIAIGRTHFIKGQQVPSCAYFPEDQVHIQEGCLKTMKQPCTISMISVYKRPISFFFFFFFCSWPKISDSVITANLISGYSKPFRACP